MDDIHDTVEVFLCLPRPGSKKKKKKKPTSRVEKFLIFRQGTFSKDIIVEKI